MIKRILSLLISTVFAALLYAGWLYIDMQNSLSTPMSYTGNLTVNSGDNMRDIALMLKEKGLFEHPEYIRLESRLKKLDSKIHVGEYQINQEMTPVDLLKMLTSGKVVQHSVTFVEGWTFKQILAALADNGSLKHTLKGQSNQQIMKLLGYEDQHPEGRFFPDSYFFTRDSTDLDILKRAYDSMQEKLATAWKKRAKDLPYESSYDALIMASIIEKETGRGDERAQISGVFVRRLNIGMKLQTDPTVIYGIGDSYDGNITRKHLRTDTPYNTYTRHGLTPTPIAMPGEAAIHAALHPEAGETLFFVAKKDGKGSHYFSKTLKEHNQAVARYQLGKK